jgi:anti-sigma B factor antagonist
VSSQLRITVRQAEGAVLVSLFGELDMSEVDSVREVLERAQAQTSRILVVDLRGLEFMDSSGIRLMVEADMRAKEEGRSLLLVRGSDAVHRVFTIALLDRRLEFIDGPPAEFPDEHGD